jgi:hypothetical protein
MAYIPEALRNYVVQRAHGLCEYCQTAQIIVVTMEIDHIVPEGADGLTIETNLCLTCHACNSFKQDFQTGNDPEDGNRYPLFNPRTQLWPDHFRWSEDGLYIIGLTSIGRATISRLRMNRDGIIASRRLWVQAGWHPPITGHFPLE